jgi:integrase
MGKPFIFKPSNSEYFYCGYDIWDEEKQGLKHHRHSLKTKDEKEAEKLRKQIERELMNGSGGMLKGPKRKRGEITVEDFWKEYNGWMQQNLRPLSVRQYQSAWGRFTQFAKPQTLRDITRQTVQDYISHKFSQLDLASIDPENMVKAENKRKRAINSELVMLRAILSWAIAEKKFNGANPFATEGRRHVKFKVPEGKPAYLEKDKIEVLIETAKKLGRDIHLACALGIYAGLRKAEIGAARWSWIDFSARTITVSNNGKFQTKNGKDRVIPLHDKLAVILKGYMPGDGYICWPQKKWEKSQYRKDFGAEFSELVKAVGLETVQEGKPVTPHTLRHTMASQLAKAGVSLLAIQKVLGHGDIKTTMIYAHLQPSEVNVNVF